MNIDDVTQAWDAAPVTAIHPLRSKDEKAYWLSGIYQATEAAKWIPEGGTVVDFGCGDGRLTFPLARMGFDVYAIDASNVMLSRLLANPESDVMPSVIQSNGMDLDTWLSDVDAVVARAVLIHHSHADAEALVHQFAHVLKQGGALIVDWPTGAHYERRDHMDVTTWDKVERARVADAAGLELVDPGTPSVWLKR